MGSMLPYVTMYSSTMDPSWEWKGSDTPNQIVGSDYNCRAHIGITWDDHPSSRVLSKEFTNPISRENIFDTIQGNLKTMLKHVVYHIFGTIEWGMLNIRVDRLHPTNLHWQKGIPPQWEMPMRFRDQPYQPSNGWSWARSKGPPSHLHSHHHAAGLQVPECSRFPLTEVDYLMDDVQLQNKIRWSGASNIIISHLSGELGNAHG